jgi:outer membrane protein assembly factor BamE
MFDHFCGPRLIPAVLVLSGLAGCGSFNAASNRAATVVSPYKIDVVQGNVVTREQVAALKTGMPRTMVRDILGTPLLTSVFHDQRWDYVFTLQRQGAASQSRKVTIFFKDDLLERIEADELPSESEFVATLKSNITVGRLPPMVAPEESLKKSSADVKPAPAAPVLPPPAQADYPPLEPSTGK